MLTLGFQSPQVPKSKRLAPELIGKIQWKTTKIPISGSGDVRYLAFDQAITKYLREVGAPGGALTVFYKGKRVYAKGFGYADLDAKRKFTALTPTRISSLSKYLTQRAINRLIELGKLNATSKAVEILAKGGVKPIGGKTDPRIEAITIQDLIDHKSGIDAGLDISQCMSDEVIKKMGFKRPISQNDALRYILGLPLNSDPGSSAMYSNFGYSLLGKIVEIVSGQSFESFVKTQVLAPRTDSSRWFVTTAQRKDHHPNEANYYSTETMKTWDAFRWDICAGAGGWVAPVDGVAELFSKEFPGLGYNFTLFGSYTGAVTVMKVHKNSLVFAASINYRRGNNAVDNDVLFKALENATKNLKLP